MKYPILVADPDLQMGGRGGRGLLSPDPGMGGGEVGACFHQTLGWGGGVGACFHQTLGWGSGR